MVKKMKKKETRVYNIRGVLEEQHEADTTLGSDHACEELSPAVNTDVLGTAWW